MILMVIKSPVESNYFVDIISKLLLDLSSSKFSKVDKIYPRSWSKIDESILSFIFIHCLLDKSWEQDFISWNLQLKK